MDRAKRHSVPIKRVYLLMAMVGIVLAAIMLFIGIVLPRQILETQIMDNNRRLMSYGMHQIDQELSNVRETVLVLAVNDKVLSQLSVKHSALDEFALKLKVQTILQNEQSINKNLTGLQVHYQGSNLQLSAFAQGAPFPRRKALDDAMIAHHSSPDYIGGGWDTCRIDNETFLLCSFTYENKTVSACVQVETFVQNCFISNLDQVNYMLMGKDDTPLYQKGQFDGRDLSISRALDGTALPEGELIIIQPSDSSYFYLAAIYPRNALLGDFSGLIQLLLVMSVIIVVSLLLLAIVMVRIGYRPIRALVAGMHEIAGGNLDYHIPADSAILEYAVMSETFNNMSRDLRVLQHDIYERRISEQKMNLQYLQLQIRPHFLHNVLHIACTMIKMGRADSAYDLLLTLIAYFRYILTDSTTLVPIRRELEHIQNFLGIQDMRFPDRISAVFDIDHEAMDHLIPPLLVFTLLENAVKHSLTDTDPLIIRLQIRVIREGAQSFIHILLTDSGSGFSPEALEQINRPEEPLDNARTGQIGLGNLLLRLRLMYGDSSKVRFYNGEDGGACNDIVIPAAKEDAR